MNAFLLEKKEESNSGDKVTEDDFAKYEELEGNHNPLLVSICAKYIDSLYGISVWEDLNLIMYWIIIILTHGFLGLTGKLCFFMSGLNLWKNHVI